MTISIALCTFNGERFLEEQLESIASQSRPPDEMVVCDDNSQDGTSGILERFARSASFPVRWSVNEKRLGPVRNFEQAMRLCASSLVALSDQDDVWFPEKLARLEQQFTEWPDAALVFSDALLIDEHGHLLDGTLWQSVDLRPPLLRRLTGDNAFAALLRRNVVTGAATMWKRECIHAALPFAEGPLLHDAWLALVASAGWDIVPVSQPLIHYRCHGAQHTGLQQRPTSLHTTQHYSEQLEQLRELAERLHDLPEKAARPAQAYSATARTNAYICHLQARINLPPQRRPRFLPALRELASGRYHRFSSGFASFAKDLAAKR